MISSDTRASIITLSVQAILYGTYDATLFHYFQLLVYDKNRSINWPVLAIILFNFILSTVYLGISYRITFATLANEKVVVDQLINISHSIGNGAMLVTDAGLIYYCYEVLFRYSAWRISILPITLWFANVVFSVFQICWAVIHMFDSNAFIAITFYTTSAIIYRYRVIYYVRRETSDPLFSFCKIFAESGISYTLTRAFNLFTTLARIEPQLLKCLFNVLNFFMTCIIFNLIQIRVKQHRISLQSPTAPTSPLRFRPGATDMEQDTDEPEKTYDSCNGC